MAQEIQTNLIHYFRSCLSFFSLPPLPLFQFRSPPTLPGTMDTLANTLREWLSMHFETGNRLVRLLHIICFILENVLDEFSGRHWAFLCSTIHGAFSGHFEPLSNFFVPHSPSSIFNFACSLNSVALDRFIEDLSFVNCLIRELISFHHFKGYHTPNLLISVVFAAADFLSILLLSKFMMSFPALPNVTTELNVNSESAHANFSPALSFITEIDPSDQRSEDSNEHLLQQHEMDLAEQNARDCEEYASFTHMFDPES
jgi:hypothetical protein